MQFKNYNRLCNKNSLYLETKNEITTSETEQAISKM